MSFAAGDWIVLGLYVAFLVVVGFWKRKQTSDEYVIGARGLALPIFVATLVATWYGSILGVGEFLYGSGVFEWTTNGLPYYVFAIVFAVFLARKVRGGAINLYTIPDKLASAYDRKTALLGAAMAFCYASPAGAILMLSVLIHALFGLPTLPSMILGVLFSVIYVYRGGFLSDVRVNALQFVLMFTGFAAAAWICLTHYGGIGYLTAPGRLPTTHLTLLGGYTLGYTLAWFFIAFNTLIDPGFHQRCYAARTPNVAFYGILIAVVCWMIFDALCLVTGLFSRALIPGLSNGMLAYPALANKIMPPWVKGLFFVGLLAPVMASAVSYTFISAMTVGRDFIWRLRQDKDTRRLPRYAQIGLVATSVLSIGFAIAIPSMVKQWYIFGSVTVPAMLIPLSGAYMTDKRWKAPADYAFWCMVAGAGASLGWLIWGWTHGGLDNPSYPLGWQPMYPGLIAGGIVYAVGIASAWRPRSTAQEPDHRDATEGDVLNGELATQRE